MADTLQAYQLPNTHLPGSTLLSKYICRQPSVMSVILAALLEREPLDDYYCGDTCLVNGARCDVLYLSRTSMPVMVQIQKKVTQSWLRSILAQCCHVIGSNTNDGDDPPPMLVIFCVEPLPSDVKAMCRVCRSTPYAYDLAAPLFAQKIRLFCPQLVNKYLDATTSQSPALPPIVALSSFFSGQHSSSLTSTYFSKHPFYDELYRHAFRFCQRLAIGPEPLQQHTPTNSTSILPQRRSITYTTEQRRLSIEQSERPVIQKKPHKRHQTLRPGVASRQSSRSAPLRPVSPSPSPPPTSIVRFSSLPSQQEDHDDKEDELQDDNNDDGEPTITDMRQHDQDVIRDYCQEQLELNKDWKTIFEEGYGKYFVYKSKESLRRCVQPYMSIGDNYPNGVTSTSQHDMDRIMKYCNQLLDQNVEWGKIFLKGKGKYFAFQNSHVLQKTYFQHLEEYKAKHHHQ